MVNEFTDLESSTEYKSKKLSKTNWEKPTYNWKEFIYSINDVIALAECVFNAFQRYPDALKIMD